MNDKKKSGYLKFSIITPSFNQGRFIEDTIQSVMNQNYSNFEHIIIDGGSTDYSIEILKKYDHLIWTSEKDRGQAHAINKGFTKASGDIVAWINSDDYYEKNIFTEVANYFKDHPECLVLYGDITFVDKEKNILSTIEGDVINHQNLIKCPDIVRQPSTFWRKSIIQEFGGVDEKFHLVMDFDFFLRISMYYQFHYFNKNFSYYRYYNENKSLSMVRRQVNEIFKVYKKNGISFTFSTYKFLLRKYLYSISIIKKLRNKYSDSKLNPEMKKKILFIDEDPGRSGSTVSLEYLVKGFSERNYNVYVLTSKKNETTKSKIKEYAQVIDLQSDTLALNLYFTNKQPLFSLTGIHEIYKDIVKVFKGFILFLRTVKAIRPDLVYLNEYSVIQASIVSHFMKIPSVVHIRSLLIKGHWGIRRYITSRLILNYNKKIFAITEIEAKRLNPNKKQLNKIFIVPEFFPVCYQSSINLEKIRDHFKLSNEKIIITMLGGILDIKGSMDFLKAGIEISTRYSEIVFVLAGKHFTSGKERLKYYEQCLQLVDVLRQTNSIIVLGEITNSLELVNASDIIVSASTETHFARPVIEAWGFGKPVVVAETEHARNLITNNENGLLYPPLNHSALANNIIKLIESKELRIKLGASGKRMVIEKFDAEKNIQIIVDQCNSLP